MTETLLFARISGGDLQNSASEHTSIAIYVADTESPKTSNVKSQSWKDVPV